MRIQRLAEADLPPAQFTQVQALHSIAWPSSEGRATLHDPGLRPELLLAYDDEDLVGSLTILRKDVDHAGRTWSVAGLSAVVTHPAARGQGVGSTLARAAYELLSGDDTDLSLFTCAPDLVEFYEAAGWHRSPAIAVVGGTPAEPLRSDDLGLVPLIAFFTDRAQAARGEFEGDVLLHPGTQDRLW